MMVQVSFSQLKATERFPSSHAVQIAVPSAHTHSAGAQRCCHKMSGGAKGEAAEASAVPQINPYLCLYVQIEMHFYDTH